jgi:hypothetical protein
MPPESLCVAHVVGIEGSGPYWREQARDVAVMWHQRFPH